MQEYKYISIPISYLEKNNISKESFMQNSPESVLFINNLLENFSPFIELKNIFLIKNSFILTLNNKNVFTFENLMHFKSFCEFIQNTNFIDFISIDNIKKEISINSDISPIFYNILYEFLI